MTQPVGFHKYENRKNVSRRGKKCRSNVCFPVEQNGVVFGKNQDPEKIISVEALLRFVLHGEDGVQTAILSSARAQDS